MPLGQQRGGAEVLLVELLRHAGQTGVIWEVVVFERGPLVDDARSLGVDTVVIDAGRLRHVHRFVRTVASVARLAKEADVVLSWMSKAHLYGSPAAMLAGKPAVWYQHGVPSRSSLADRAINVLPADGILTVSKKGQARQEALWPSRKTRLVYPGVDLDRFRSASVPDLRAVRRSVGIGPDVPLVGVVARLQRWKGIHLLIEALPHVHTAFPETIALVVGGPHFSELDYGSELLELAGQLGVSDKVVFTGLRRDVPALLSVMDVVAHPAYDEPFGISVVEAMAMGRPVVASDTGGPLEIIEDGESGVLFRTGDAIALADGIKRVLIDRKAAAAMGQNARQRAEAFSAVRFAREVGEALTEFAARS